MVYLIFNGGGQVESVHNTDPEARASLGRYLAETPEAGPFEVQAFESGEREKLKVMKWQTQTPIFLSKGVPLEVKIVVPAAMDGIKYMLNVERKTNRKLVSVNPDCLKGNVYLWLDTGVGAPLQGIGAKASFTVNSARIPAGEYVARITCDSTSPALFFLAKI